MYQKASQVYLQALSLTITARDSLVLYNNLSNIYRDQNLFTQAESTLIKASNLFGRVGDTLEKARVTKSVFAES